jgi:hypothetical protein
LELIESLEPKIPAEQASIQVKLLRGLYYVHLYSALEKTTNECVEQALLLISGQRVENWHYQNKFNVVSLYARMQAFKAAGYRSFLSKSVDVFSTLDSPEVSKIDNTIFSSTLQNVWFKALDEVYKCFGIPEFSVESHLRLSVDEVVDKRNAVAHGRESAIYIGERHRSYILRTRTQDIQLIADKFVDGLESYVLGLEHIKLKHRASYGALKSSTSPSGEV